MHKLSVQMRLFFTNQDSQLGRIIFIRFTAEGKWWRGVWMITHMGAEVMVNCGQSHILTDLLSP